MADIYTELAEYKAMYKRASAEIDSLHSRLETEIKINNQYRDFFTANSEYCNWMRDHNAQFEAFRASPYYIKSFPQVDRSKPLE